MKLKAIIDLHYAVKCVDCRDTNEEEERVLNRGGSLDRNQVVRRRSKPTSDVLF